MSNLLLLIGIFAIIGAGYIIWKLGSKRNGPVLETPGRRRENARDWQRRFGADSLLAANFLQPTQNEILETLSILDHLAPGWEIGDPGLIENHFLNELAVSFPSLRKPKCIFPLPFAETLTAKNSVGSGRGKQPITESEVVARRESFRTGRAHANALEQIVAGSAGPAEITPGSLPFRVSAETSPAPAKNPWPARLAAAVVIIAALLGVSYYYDRTPQTKTELGSHAEPSLSPAVVPADPTIQTTPAPAEPVAVAAFTPVPPPEPRAAPSPIAASTPPPVKEPLVEKMVLNTRIAASQQRAVGKYPSLAVEGSEINLRFVFRYKNLVRENSPRLLDPTWPEQLAEECAAAAAAGSKPNTLTQVTAPRR